MPDTPRLDTPRVRVTMTDGRELDVQTENPDMIFFDLERARKKWPALTDAPFLWLSYLAYSKLKRSEQIPAPVPAFETWILDTSSVVNLDANGNPAIDSESADPTRPALAPG